MDDKSFLCLVNYVIYKSRINIERVTESDSIFISAIFRQLATFRYLTTSERHLKRHEHWSPQSSRKLYCRFGVRGIELLWYEGYEGYEG